jgi:hypothetical protein
MKTGAEKVSDSSDKLYFKAVSVIEKAENAAKGLGISVSDVKGVAKLLQVNEKLDIEGVDIVGEAKEAYNYLA